MQRALSALPQTAKTILPNKCCTWQKRIRITSWKCTQKLRSRNNACNTWGKPLTYDPLLTNRLNLNPTTSGIKVRICMVRCLTPLPYKWLQAVQSRVHWINTAKYSVPDFSYWERLPENEVWFSFKVSVIWKLWVDIPVK